MSGRIPLLGEIWEMSRSRGAVSESPYLWEGTVNAWPTFEGGGGITHDVGGYNNHAALVNMEPESDWVLSDAGWALDLDGADEVMDAGDIATTDGLSHFSVSIWARLDDLQNESYAGVIAKQADSSNRWGFSQHVRNPNVMVMLANGANAFGLTTDNWLTAGDWYFYTMVFDGTQAGNDGRLKFYVDGELKNLSYTGTVPSTTPTNDASLLIGALGTNNWQGRVRNASLFDRSLPLHHIQELYEDPWSRYRRRPVQAPVAAVNDVTGTNPFGSSGVDFTWTVNP